MNRKALSIIPMLLILSILFSLAGCGSQPEQPAASAQDVFYALLNKVEYDTELSDYSDSAATAYLGLPEGAVVKMYSGNGRYADELTWISVASEADLEDAMKVVDRHIDEMHDQYLSYHAEEVPKIDSCLIWKDSTNIILCITDDSENAKAISENPGKADPQLTDAATETQAPTENPSTDDPATEPPTEAPTEPPAASYPEITTDSGWRNMSAATIVGNHAFEYYAYDDSAATAYANLVSTTAQQLNGQSDVYCIVIPTAIGIVFPDNLSAEYPGWEHQGERLEQIYGKMNNSVIPVNIYDKMMQHRDEYLYFRTDWHWTGIGAYYGYERFCEVKGITPYTMDQRTEHAYEGYLGPLYSQTCNKDAALAATPDTVYAYEPYFEDTVTMIYTDTNGNRIQQQVVENGDNYGAGLKYLIFAAGDQPITEFTNTSITDDSVAIVVKESFGNAMMSYFVDHYSKVYEIDYRHWEGDLVQFARQVGADDVIFANNIGMVRSSFLIGQLDRIIP